MAKLGKLKIAMIAPLAERVPPEKYGGTERVVYTLTEELVKRGHKVKLFASGDSQTSAELISVYPRPLRQAKIHDPYGLNEITLLNIGTVYDMQHEFDIIHDHLGSFSIPTANLSKTPVVMTLHGAFTSNSRMLFKKFKNPYLVAISNSQAASAPDLNYIGVVHNGLDMKNYPFSDTHDGYLLFVGRISMEKGVHHAIDVAQSLNLPLIIAAKLDDVEIPYFEQYVKPRLSNGYIKWVGEVTEDERNALMAKALCFLHPITWKEPFGLAMIEAMACGCPVVALNKGSVPEIVKDAITGFVCDDIDAMIDGVSLIGKIKRRDCRQHALSNFDAQKMVDNYEEIYYKAIDLHRARSLSDKIVSSEQKHEAYETYSSPGQQAFQIYIQAKPSKDS